MEIPELKAKIAALIEGAALNQLHVADLLDELAEEQRQEFDDRETA